MKNKKQEMTMTVTSAWPKLDPPMTVKKVDIRLKEIEKVKNDFETAHDFEDQLYRDIMKQIADGTLKRPKKVAREALKSLMIDFPRYYA